MSEPRPATRGALTPSHTPSAFRLPRTPHALAHALALAIPRKLRSPLGRLKRAHQEFVDHRKIVRGELLFEVVGAPHAMNVVGRERPVHENAA